MEDHKETNHMIVYYPIVPFKRPELIQKHIEMAISVKYGLGKYHLLKNNCEHFATLCVVGVPFSKQADITFNSTNGKIDKEYVLKKMEESNELFSKRNILLIGSTGAGKSTLANVISGKSGENALKEAESSTRFSDTQLTLAQIISRIARGCEKIKDGINQVLFVIGKRFTPEEVKTYNMLKDFFFDKEVTKYTTIVRTNFTNFEDKDICANDIEGLIKESNEGVVEMINSCDKRIIHVDNPSININFNDSNKERVETQIGLNKAVREESRKILLKHLKTCEKVYKPENFDKVDKLIKDDVMKENKRLRKELKKIKSERKKEDLIQERVIELNKKIDDLKEEIKNNEKLIERKMIELIGDNLKAVIEVCRTGSGKSTLANVITGKDEFKEGEYSFSETKDFKAKEFEESGIKYQVIDTPGINDSKILTNLEELISFIKEDGLSQMLFVTRGKLTKEEKSLYNLLKKTIFNEDIIYFTTIVRTSFDNFEDRNSCAHDINLIVAENEESGDEKLDGELIKRIIHVDNPSLDIIGEGKRAEQQKELNKEIRKCSRKMLLKHLETCKEVYETKDITKNFSKQIEEYLSDKTGADLSKKKGKIRTIIKGMKGGLRQINQLDNGDTTLEIISGSTSPLPQTKNNQILVINKVIIYAIRLLEYKDNKLIERKRYAKNKLGFSTLEDALAKAERIKEAERINQ
ncbi:1564_t:CDS:2 [Funneliformis geosporum]|uniref:1564_t:CDS:1 n=1 Tax=Funneliformis geosporum TaxID=1117311 RepID=A0A9W4SDS9_9GLOM|nr:1564_t:CDS:2 [Funneliformis geosporum]